MMESQLFKAYIVGPAAAFAVAVGIISVVLTSRGGGEPRAGADLGGKERVPPAALAVLEKMPRHPNAVSVNEPVAVDRGAEQDYAAQGDGPRIIAFYEHQLHTKGWQAEGPMTVEYSDPHLDGTVAKMHQQTFITDDSKVTVTAVENEKIPDEDVSIEGGPKQEDQKERKQKDPKQGNVRLSLLVEPF